ncbi:MAG: hypothetical protein ACOYW3_04615 [Bacteroidota bacterium]
MRPYLFFLAAAALLLLGTVAFTKSELSTLPSFTIVTVVFLMLIHSVLYKNISKYPVGSVERSRMYLLSIVVKLIFGFGYLLTIVLLEPSTRVLNAMVFLVGYLLFTGVEIVLLTRKGAG